MTLAAGDGRGAEGRLRYQELFDFAPEGYVVTDTAGLIEQVNHAAAALLKSRRDFLVGKPLAMFFTEPGHKLVYSHLTRLDGLRPGSVAEWDCWLRPLRSSPVAVNLNVAVVPDDDARRRLRWRLRDITAHVHAEQDLQAEKSLADSLFDDAPTAILVLDSHGCVLRSNPSARLKLGYDEEELRGREWAGLLPAEQRANAALLLQQCLQGPVGQRLTVAIRRKDGQPRTISWSVKALASLEDNPAALVAVGHDVTDLLAAQQAALQAARLAAIGELTAGLAHEGRNALQRALACLERLRWRLTDQSDEIDLLGRAAQALAVLTGLFEDVRGYAGPIRLDAVTCHLGDVWREAWAQALAVAAGPPPDLAEDAACGLWVFADGGRLTQVFRNLFENALQASGSGGRVEVVCRDGNLAGRPAILVSVRDTGPGLGDAAGRAFEAFFTTKVRGTGLGLAIARRIVETHGGQITAADREGGGAEFTIVLPRSPT